MHEVSKGSVLGPLLFNIHTCDMFFIVEDYNIASYADDNTPYYACETSENVMLNLEKLSKNLFQWFYLNQIKGNPDEIYYESSRLKYNKQQWLKASGYDNR